MPLRKRYGCDYCADTVKRKQHDWDDRRECIHDECPYTELQESKSFSDYLKKSNDRSVSVMLKTLEKTK